MKFALKHSFIPILACLLIAACTPPSNDSFKVNGNIVQSSEIIPAIKAAMSLLEAEIPFSASKGRSLGNISFEDIIKSEEISELIAQNPNGNITKESSYGTVSLESNLNFTPGTSDYTGSIRISIDDQIILDETKVKVTNANDIITASAIIDYSDQRIYNGILISLSVRLKATSTGIGVIFDSLEYKGKTVANIKAIEEQYNLEYQNQGYQYIDPSDVMPAGNGEAPASVKALIHEMFILGMNKYSENAQQPIIYEYKSWKCNWNLNETSSFSFSALKGNDSISYSIPVDEGVNENYTVQINYNDLNLTMKFYEVYSGPDLLQPYMILIEKSIHDAMVSYENRKYDFNELSRDYYNSYDWSVEGGDNFHWISKVMTESSWGIGNNQYTAIFNVLIESPLANIDYSFDVRWFLNKETALPMEFIINGVPSGTLMPEKYHTLWP